LLSDIASSFGCNLDIGWSKFWEIPFCSLDFVDAAQQSQEVELETEVCST
jgi:hypothetical protein